MAVKKTTARPVKSTRAQEMAVANEPVMPTMPMATMPTMPSMPTMPAMPAMPMANEPVMPMANEPVISTMPMANEPVMPEPKPVYTVPAVWENYLAAVAAAHPQKFPVQNYDYAAIEIFIERDGVNFGLSAIGREYYGIEDEAPKPVRTRTAVPNDFDIRIDNEIIPIPESGFGNARGKKAEPCPFPFDKMQKGQSFFVACDIGTEMGHRQYIKAANWISKTNTENSVPTGRYLTDPNGVILKDRSGNNRIERNYSKRFVLRKQTGGFRIWREL